MYKNKIILSLATITALSLCKHSFAELVNTPDSATPVPTRPLMPIGLPVEKPTLRLITTPAPVPAAANNIFEAIAKGDLNETKKFIKDVNKLNKAGLTPLHFACMGDSLEIIKALIKNGATASINVVDKTGNTPLFYACAGPKDRNNLKIVYFLLDNGANIDWQADATAAKRKDLARLFKIFSKKQAEAPKIKTK